MIDRAFDHPLEQEEHATAPLAGGIKQHGYQCGMVWGAALAAGARAYQLWGAGPDAEARAIAATQKTVDTFRTQNDAVNCIDITHLDTSSSTWQMITYFLLKGGSIGCFRMAGKYAPQVFRDINEVYSDSGADATPAPVSCSSLLAQKLGASELQTVMAAGLAGGIGLCGSACGALGAAIWIMGMRLQEARDVKNLWSDKVFTTKFDELMDRFLQSSDYEFECAEIVGRKFDSISDHAVYLREGGCAKIIDTLGTN